MTPRVPSPVPVKAGYDLWSKTYDAYPNPTVATDERHFPGQWSHLKGLRVIEVGCGSWGSTFLPACSQPPGPSWAPPGG